MFVLFLLWEGDGGSGRSRSMGVIRIYCVNVRTSQAMNGIIIKSKFKFITKKKVI